MLIINTIRQAQKRLLIFNMFRNLLKCVWTYSTTSTVSFSSKYYSKDALAVTLIWLFKRFIMISTKQRVDLLIAPNCSHSRMTATLVSVQILWSSYFCWWPHPFISRSLSRNSRCPPDLPKNLVRNRLLLFLKQS